MLASLIDLILPLVCGGCGAPGTRWCDECARALLPGDAQPHLVTPRVNPGVPVFSLGRYAGVRRQAVVALKDRGRTDLSAPLAHPLAVGIHRLLTWRILDAPLTIVPAPTRWSAARRRGGDPVTSLVTRATREHPDLTVASALRMRAGARDSVGLGSGARERNVAGRVRLTRSLQPDPVLLVDDIVTTGATIAESVRVLRSAGIGVAGALTLAHA